MHVIKLDGYNATVDNGEKLELGTFDSFGEEQLQIVKAPDWVNLSVIATFNPPNRKPVQAVVDSVTGVIKVPKEATAGWYGVGTIVFVGIADGVQRISSDVEYIVKRHSNASGTEPAEPTPSVVEQILTEAQNANVNSAEAKKLATDAKDIVQSVRTDADNGKFNGKDGAKGDKGDDGTTPQLKIGEDNLWHVSYDNGATWVSLGVKATGAAGKDGEGGLTPHIGENGNWWVGDTDTGVSAKGIKGDPGPQGPPGEIPEDYPQIREDVSKLKEDTAVLQKRQNVLVGSETGNPIAVDDAFAAPLCGLTVYGKSTQVRTTGAQLISLNDSYGVTTVNGVTKTTIGISAWKLEGISKEDAIIYPYSLSNFLSLSKGDYVFSVFGTSKAKARYTIIGKGSSGYIPTGHSQKISIQEDVKLTFNFIVENGVESNGILMIMLNSGSTSLPWEPYTRGEPSPSPNYPQEIESAGDGGSVVVTLSNGNGKTQTLTLPTPNGLPGIPVTSGGNYTDQNGQRWVCDEVDLERGVKVQRIGKAEIDRVSVSKDPKWFDANKSYSYEITDFTLIFSDTSQATEPCSRFIMSRFHSFYDKGIETGGLAGQKYAVFNISKTFGICTTVEEFKAWFKENVVLYKILAAPIETPLTPAEIATYKALTTYAPDTVVQASNGAGVKLEYQRDVNIAIKKLEDAVASMTAT